MTKSVKLLTDVATQDMYLKRKRRYTYRHVDMSICELDTHGV